MALANPFKPTAGKMPPILIGRQSIIDDFTEALENGAGAPGRIMLITGQRGFGKTVMLTEFRRMARARHWETIAETASAGLITRLVTALAPTGMRLDQADISPSIGIAGVATASLGQARFSAEASPLTLRNALNKRLGSRKIGKGKGILITIDETQAATQEDLVAIATAVQHVITDADESNVPDADKKGVAIVFAGLPYMINELLDNEVTTFLRRALRRELDNVPLPDVKNAYLETIEDSGKTIDAADALDAARLSEGYPYMVQLIGYYMWQAAQRRRSDVIDTSDVETALSDALLAFDDAVCAPAMDGTTSAEKLFLKAMAKDSPNPTQVGDLMERTRRSRSWVSKYRAALIKDQLIRPAGHGQLEFAVPHLGQYLQSL
ncbi:ATP-binding protein [Bifidobacterium tissieri]|uniref:ATP-binding protein n=1 Tax=Bifidobacterium tissieri TaxID=1630162 RepID=A0A5M9ZLX2_9BIFI|nr:ATP-binding protein [Bifidobacterium tissieri]KAA8827882.1 ATP-binding protein [Bifidobacterium tissieri]KAA8830005.1 ATP-binding protein [Bifidobacterium tissieri]